MKKRTFAEVEQLMHTLDIPYEIVEHPASHSTEESDRYIEGHEGCRSSTMMLANRKSNHFYMVMKDDVRKTDMEDLATRIGANKLHFISADRLSDMLGLTSGIVSLFGLVGTHYDNLSIYFEKRMLEEHKVMTVHPNDNTKTIFFPMEACFKIIESQGYHYEIIDL